MLLNLQDIYIYILSIPTVICIERIFSTQYYIHEIMDPIFAKDSARFIKITINYAKLLLRVIV